MTVFEEFGDPDRSTRAGWFARIAHALPAILVLLVTTRALQWAEILRLEEWPLWFNIAHIVIVTSALLCGLVHIDLARLCLRCMQAVPADAPLRVHRYQRLLWFSHRVQGWRYFSFWLVLSIPASVAPLMLGVESHTMSWLNAPADLYVAAYLWGQWKHHRYRPWCPYCRRWDDGGSREPSPDPVGDGTKVA